MSAQVKRGSSWVRPEFTHPADNLTFASSTCELVESLRNVAEGQQETLGRIYGTLRAMEYALAR